MTSPVKSTLNLCIPTQKFQNMAELRGESRFGTLFFNLIRWIQLCDKKNLTFVDCCDKILKCSLNNIFQDSFDKLLPQKLTHDRSYISLSSLIKKLHG